MAWSAAQRCSIRQPAPASLEPSGWEDENRRFEIGGSYSDQFFRASKASHHGLECHVVVLNPTAGSSIAGANRLGGREPKVRKQSVACRGGHEKRRGREIGLAGAQRRQSGGSIGGHLDCASKGSRHGFSAAAALWR